MRLEFGRPTSVSQALYRLPGKDHSRYDKEEGVEHVAHFKKRLTILHHLIENEVHIPLEIRWIPLQIEGMKLLKTSNSFVRKPDPILTVSWEYVSNKSYWGKNFFPSGNEEYRWWQISEMDPNIDLPKYKLICVETNNQFDKSTHYNKHSDFDLFIMKPEDLEFLAEVLMKNNRE